MAHRGIAFLALIVTALAAPLSSASEPKVDFALGQWHRAALEINEATELPFLLWLPNAQGDAVIRNGNEDILVEFRRTSDGFVLDFPHYDSRINATVGIDDTYRGEWTKMRSSGEAKVGFRLGQATQGQHMPVLFPMHDTTLVMTPWPLYGDWAMDFAESGVARGEFRSWYPDDPGVYGTVLTPTGDYRFLSGVARIEEFEDARVPRFHLSVFDGAHAFLFTGEQSDRNTIVGDFYSGNWWHETFTARRLGPDEVFELPDPFSEVALTSGDGTLNIEALDKPRYRGKPVIVQIFGTWCPNCHDETPVLRDLYERYREDGLQVLGLAYEVTGDDARSRRQVERFKEKFGIDWEIEIAGTSDKAQASKTLPDISAVKSFPTTIWIGRDGKVRAIHSGFAGPATGDEHVELVAEFEALTEGIVGRD